jgi:hypothetical protein
MSFAYTSTGLAFFWLIYRSSVNTWKLILPWLCDLHNPVCWCWLWCLRKIHTAPLWKYPLLRDWAAGPCDLPGPIKCEQKWHGTISNRSFQSHDTKLLELGWWPDVSRKENNPQSHIWDIPNVTSTLMINEHPPTREHLQFKSKHAH